MTPKGPISLTPPRTAGRRWLSPYVRLALAAAVTALVAASPPAQWGTENGRGRLFSLPRSQDELRSDSKRVLGYGRGPLAGALGAARQIEAFRARIGVDPEPGLAECGHLPERALQQCASDTAADVLGLHPQMVELRGIPHDAELKEASDCAVSLREVCGQPRNGLGRDRQVPTGRR